MKKKKKTVYRGWSSIGLSGEYWEECVPAYMDVLQKMTGKVEKMSSYRYFWMEEYKIIVIVFTLFSRFSTTGIAIV